MNSSTITLEELCGLFDHTNLKAFATEQDFKQLCSEAADNHFAMVAINSYPVKICKKFLKGTNVHVGAAIAFPLGQMTVESKLAETQNAICDGADEIDYVLNVGKVKEGDFAYIEEEMTKMVALCKSKCVLIKVIFENCYLTKEEIKKVSEIAFRVRPDFIKTSTGFGTSGAAAEDIKIMKQAVGDAVKVKAAGGVRSWEDCKAMIDAGAERIGTSSSFKIIEEYQKSRL